MPSDTVKTFEILVRPELELFPLDKRIIMLDHPDQFAEHKNFDGGVLCPVKKLMKGDLSEIADFIQIAMKRPRNFDHPEVGWEMYESTEVFPAAITSTFATMRQAFRQVSDRRDEILLARINSFWPLDPHNHDDVSFTYTLGPGTEVLLDGGRFYQVPEQYIFGMSPRIWHRASQGFAPENLFDSAPKNPKPTLMTVTPENR